MSEAKTSNHLLDHSEEFIVMFLGYLTAKLPELHRVEPMRIKGAWDDFKREMGKMPAVETTGMCRKGPSDKFCKRDAGHDGPCDFS
jgi:hypothetical protein